MGKKSTAAAERMALACEKMASVFEEMGRRDQLVKELQARIEELAAFNNRLMRDRELRDNTNGLHRADPIVP
jgi:hypothetical protein